MREIALYPELMGHARDYTKSLFNSDTLRHFDRKPDFDFSPIGWHLGHIGVTEGFWVLQRCFHMPSLSVEYDKCFSPLDNPKHNRTNLPPVSDIFDYVDAVRSQVLTLLETRDWADDDPLLSQEKILNMLLQHEEQHSETILMILNLIFGELFDAGEDLPQCDCGPRFGMTIAGGASEEMIRVPAGRFVMGADDCRTTLDNERPANQIYVKEFLIDRGPVTNEEFQHFITRGGYEKRGWWTSEGWAWRQDACYPQHPLHWRLDSVKGRWLEIEPFGARELPPGAPVTCISWYEADAFARSVGKRLPTEAEWEKAAGAVARRKIVQAAEGKDAACSMVGDVWEWTDTWFHSYAGFQPFAYAGYSVPYFDGRHKVLRGGSWATRKHVLRKTFRNWYEPGTRAVFAGLRCAKNITH